MATTTRLYDLVVLLDPNAPDDRHREILGRIRVTQLVALYPTREEALAFLADA